MRNALQNEARVLLSKDVIFTLELKLILQTPAGIPMAPESHFTLVEMGAFWLQVLNLFWQVKTKMFSGKVRIVPMNEWHTVSRSSGWFLAGITTLGLVYCLRIIESPRVQKASKMIQSNCPPTTDISH